MLLLSRYAVVDAKVRKTAESVQVRTSGVDKASEFTQCVEEERGSEGFIRNFSAMHNGSIDYPFQMLHFHPACGL